VKQFINILFLGLSILFSFGFTSFQSVCELKTEIIESKRSCCQDEEKKNDTDKHIKGECCKTDYCEGACCIESIDFLLFNDFVFQTESVNVDELEVSLIPSIHTFLLSLRRSKLDSFQNELIIPPDLFVNNTSASQIIINKQAWLI